MKPADTDSITVNGVVFTHRDIENVVNDFYTRVAQDPILSVPFSTVQDWPEHIGHMTHFWWIRFGGPGYISYSYNPVAKHFAAGFNADFLARWLELFGATLQSRLQEDQQRLWALIAARIGESLRQKDEFFRSLQAKGGSAF